MKYYELIANDKAYSIYAEDIKFINDHKIPEEELTYSQGGDMVDLEHLFILKYEDISEDDMDDDDEDYLF